MDDTEDKIHMLEQGISAAPALFTCMRCAMYPRLNTRNSRFSKA
jgi:hypothetical protein